MTTDAALGSDVPFDPRIQRARNQRGQVEVAAILAGLLAGSRIRDSHLDCERVQDPYSLRCQPQVMGAGRDMLAEAAITLEREANGVSDNPLVFVEEGQILSGGNFHAEPVAFAADKIAVVMAEIGNLSERRMALLTNSSQSGLPAFLTPNPGLNSGFMIPQVVSAALATENKHLANAVATDTVPTCANQEDHVSLATYAARRLHLMADNLARLLAVEIAAAAQGIELRRPLRSSRDLGAGVGDGARGLPVPRRRPSAGCRDRDRWPAWCLLVGSDHELHGRSRTLDEETHMPEILKANNRAWAARMVAADPGFFRRLERQQAPRLSVDRLLRQPRARPTRSSASIPASCSSIATSPISPRRRTPTISPCCSSPSTCCKVKHIMVVGHYGCGGVAAAVDGKRRGLVDHWLHPIREVYHDHRHELDAITERTGARLDRLCELNVIRQVPQRRLGRVRAGGLGPRPGALRSTAGSIRWPTG